MQGITGAARYARRGPHGGAQLAGCGDEGGLGGRRTARLFGAEPDTTIHVVDGERVTILVEGFRDGGEWAGN